MATKAQVQDAFSSLRDDLQSKMDSGDYNAWFEPLRRLHLAVARPLATFQQSPAHGEASEQYDAAVTAANSALSAARALQPGQDQAFEELRQLALRGTRELQAVTAATLPLHAAREFTTGLRGGLRVSPQVSGPSAATTLNQLADAGRPVVTGTTETQPPYIASVALLFPIEAATLFPLGRSIAASDPYALSTVILLIVGFIITLRYFATQESSGGSPAVKEIILAVASFLLWVGALGGYWVAGPRGIDLGISADLGGKLFGFATIMWVAIVPYFIRKPGSTTTGS